MPWCPKCNTEYEEGVLACVDCEVDLVEDINDDSLKWVTLAEGQEDTLEELLRFLKYSKIDQARLERDEEGEKAILQVYKEVYEEAKKYVSVYLYNKKIEGESEADPMVENSVDEKASQQVVYEDKEKKVEDLKSSAFSFITVGLLGFGFVILIMLDVIPMYVDTSYRYLFFGFLLVVTLGFVMIGIISLSKIKKYKAEANQFTEEVKEIKSWFLSIHNAKEIDHKTLTEEIKAEQNEETMYFVRFEYIKDKITVQYPNLPLTIVEGVADDLYDELFG